MQVKMMSTNTRQETGREIGSVSKSHICQRYNQPNICMVTGGLMSPYKLTHTIGVCANWQPVNLLYHLQIYTCLEEVSCRYLPEFDQQFSFVLTGHTVLSRRSKLRIPTWVWSTVFLCSDRALVLIENWCWRWGMIWVSLEPAPILGRYNSVLWAPQAGSTGGIIRHLLLVYLSLCRSQWLNLSWNSSCYPPSATRRVVGGG